MAGDAARGGRGGEGGGTCVGEAYARIPACGNGTVEPVGVECRGHLRNRGVIEAQGCKRAVDETSVHVDHGPVARVQGARGRIIHNTHDESVEAREGRGVAESFGLKKREPPVVLRAGEFGESFNEPAAVGA